MRKIRSTIAAALALIAAPAAGEAVTAEPPSYTDPLPSEPRDIVAAFLRDHTAWNAFAREHYDRTGDYTVAETAYRRLIDLYCGPQKSHQGIVFSSNARYDAERSEILEEREEDGRSIVTIRHTGANDFVTVHEFAFVARDGRWWLQELFYYDDYGDEWLPSL
ncbi:hypothetical protein [Qipengyuania gaetbuli]|uniref:hypothetical protein n=1 Tax=Qipengyuania gaetbuli TaxID=266952 RepID=UPI001CFDCDBB|nr:hypothetical protein [Qipengyuania gaetbuli]